MITGPRCKLHLLYFLVKKLNIQLLKVEDCHIPLSRRTPR